jgi:ketosteroid isomerase-like protein
VRRTLEAIWRRDSSRAVAYFRADVEWHNTAAFPGPATVVGPEAIVAFWDELLESFDEDLRDTQIEESRVDGDVVVVGVHTQGRGKSSGVPLDIRYALRFELSDGKIQRVDVHGDYGKAVVAAGLGK